MVWCQCRFFQRSHIYTPRFSWTLFRFTRQETRDGATRPLAKDYYFIDYRRAVDSTKFRLHTVHERIRAATSSLGQEERKEYICRRCHSQYTAIEVLDSLDPAGRGTGFLCKRCRNPLDELGEDAIQQDDTTALFNKQFASIMSILQKIDETTVPEVTGEQALADMRPMPRTELNPAPKTQAAPAQVSRPTAVSGMATGPEKIEVAITSGSETTAAQQAADAERRARIAAQNQMPEWHERSTVTGEFVKGATSGSTSAPAGPAVSAGEEKHVDDNDDSARLARAFEQLEQERQRRLEEEDDEEEDDDEDDEDDFEDVDGIRTSGVDTPNGETNTGAESAVNGQLPAVKINAPSSDAVSSNTAIDELKNEGTALTMETNTPKESDEDDDDFEDVPSAVAAVTISSSSESLAGTKRALDDANGEVPEAKKGKLTGDTSITSSASKGAEESDEDEADFEDVTMK